MVALSPRYNSWSRDIGLRFAANVHDELMESLPLEVLYDPNVHKEILSVLQTSNIEYRVPIIAGLGVSKVNWSEAAGKDVTKDGDGEIIGGPLK